MARRRPSRTRLVTDERRAQLLALGVDAFVDASYDEVSIDDIARAAGVSKGLVYHYFPTKRDLYIEAIREVGRRLMDETLAAPEGATMEARLRLGVDRFLAWVAAHPRSFAAVMGGGVGSDPQVAAVIDEIRDTFLERIVEGGRAIGVLAKDGDWPLGRLALRGWIGLVERTALAWAEKPEPDRTAVRNLLADSLPQLMQLALRS